MKQHLKIKEWRGRQVGRREKGAEKEQLSLVEEKGRKQSMGWGGVVGVAT